MTSHTTLRERLAKEWSKANNEFLWTTATESPEVVEWFLSFIESELSSQATKIREEERVRFLKIVDHLEVARPRSASEEELYEFKQMVIQEAKEALRKTLLPSEGESNPN